MGNPRIAFNIVLMAFVGTFAYNWGVTLPILARYALDGGPEGFGALNVAMGVGSVLGGVLLATRVVPSERLVLISAAVYSVLVTLLALSPSMNVALGQLVLVGALSIIYTASSNTLLQIEAREEFRGRVLSLYTLLMIGSTPFGSTITGLVADSFDVRLALEINAGICLIGLVVAALFLLRARRKAVVPA
jgi:predicted MFS family arabinose efflux permease